jgi:hypothetical protein
MAKVHWHQAAWLRLPRAIHETTRTKPEMMYWAMMEEFAPLLALIDPIVLHGPHISFEGDHPAFPLSSILQTQPPQP